MEKLTINEALYEQKSLWIMGIYFILTFYFFGVFTSMYITIYPETATVHKNFSNFMITLNAVTRIIYSFVPVVMIFAAIGLLWFRSKSFPLWAILISILMCLISVISTFYLILPLQSELSLHGFNLELHQKLVHLCLYSQILPTAIQVLLAYYLLNIYLKSSKLLGRSFFIIIFTFSYFTLGSSQIEGFINYPIWLQVDLSDWVTFRAIINDSPYFLPLFIVAVLPLLLVIPMLWWRPKAIPKLYIAIYGLSLVWVIATTIIYFIPVIQGPLTETKQNTKSLIEELMKNDFLLRMLYSMGYYVIPIAMFLKIGNRKIEEQIAS
jgi:hypothetical protein